MIATLAGNVQEDKAHLPQHLPLKTFFLGERLLNDNAEALFGRSSSPRRVRIMVTIPTEAAHDVQLWAGRRRCDALAEVLHDEEKRQALRLRWGSKERTALCALFRLKAEPTEEQMTDLLKNVIIVRLRPCERVEAATTPVAVYCMLFQM